jgi:cellulose synthase/poly-beta-1,6-N-acetylglucosamine synthase-like glycosyltransferase
LTLPQVLVLGVYYAMLAVLAVVMGYRALMVLRYYLHGGSDPAPAGRFPTEPFVTIQLPVFNEQYVVERLLETVCAIEWPRDRLEVQLLDDSTDDSREIAARKVAELRAKGHDVVHLHRTDRRGYKAGALGAGVPRARGEFLAVFDADFVPEPDFLRKTIDHFSDPKVGFVQTRWTYLNQDYGVLTQGMAMLLDGHFVLEQTTRARGGYIFPFNGTGGVWRKSTIAAAGGWHADTICEDTDLSYRAHLAGYRGVYLRDVPCPGELPVELSAVKSQQHRWAKGVTECFLKMMPLLWRSRLPFRKKLDASFHLGAYLAFPASLFMTVLTLPVMLLRMQGHGATRLATFVDGLVFFLVVVTQVVFYVAATREVHARWWTRMRYLPFFPIVGVGLAVNNARGVLEALLGHRTEFVRTPKLGIVGRDAKTVAVRSKTYRAAREWVQPILEVALGSWYVHMGLQQMRMGLVAGGLITLVLSIGLFAIGGSALRVMLGGRRPPTAPPTDAVVPVPPSP